jgi:hypothetical protein
LSGLPLPKANRNGARNLALCHDLQNPAAGLLVLFVQVSDYRGRSKRTIAQTMTTAGALATIGEPFNPVAERATVNAREWPGCFDHERRELNHAQPLQRYRARPQRG